jgi:hypothetical protein
MKERVEGYFYISWSGRVYYVSIRGLRCTIYDIESHIAVDLLARRRLTVEDVGRVTAYIEAFGVEELKERLARRAEVLRVFMYEPRGGKKKAEVSEEARG